MTAVGAAGAAARPRRITMLLENHAYPGDTRVRNEAETLVADGHRVTVHAPRLDGQPARETLAGVEVRRFRGPQSDGTRRGYLVEYLTAHLQLIPRGLLALRSREAVVHLHNPPDTLFPVAWAARALGRRAVYDMHDAAPELFAEKFGSSRVEAVLRACQRLSLRAADAVLVTNEPQREVAVRSTSRVTVVRNGPRRATLAAAPAARGGALTDPRLLFVGNVELQDGVLMLADLVARLRREHGLAGARLTVAGDGTELDALRRAADAAGVADAVTCLGRVPHDRVAELIAAADICLEPAPCSPLNHQTSMIKVAEYLAGGRPVVAFALDETRRMAGDGGAYARCGDPADFAAVVAGLARDPERRAALARSGRDRAADLVWERSAEALIETYRGL
jgi:glycosyltransferase involved in cell wall biosynthesis